MDKTIKERIANLIKEERYDDVYREYGIKAYKRYVPSNYRKQDLAKLKREGRYEDIFNKYGKNEYDKILIKAMYEEIKEVKGGFKANLWKIAHKLKIYSVTAAFAVSLALPTVTTAFAVMTEKDINDNSKKYEDQIETYDKKIDKYAKKVNEIGLSDIQIFMKVMDDMWEGIKGYGNPEKNISGFLELDLADEDGYGVCRNMASDIARKLNKINPEYNARTMAVLMGEDSFYKIADINRNILETNSTIEETTEEDSKSNKLKETVANLLGNHMVTLVDVPSDNLTIVLDPTNPGIGVYIDGKIIMLNDTKGEKVNYNTKEYSEAVFIRGGIDGMIKIASDYIKSFGKSNLSFKEILDKYGSHAQDIALKEVRGKEKKANFRESIRVETLEEQSSILTHDEKSENIEMNIEQNSQGDMEL